MSRQATPRDTHDWFGFCCQACGTTADRPEANQPCVPLSAAVIRLEAKPAPAAALVERATPESGINNLHENRSPDGDGHPIERALRGSDAGLTPRQLTDATVLPLATEPRVHARVGAVDHVRTSVKEVAGSEPADSHSPPAVADRATAPAPLDGLGAVIERLERFRLNEIAMRRMTGYQDDTIYLIVRDLQKLELALRALPSRRETGEKL